MIEKKSPKGNLDKRKTTFLLVGFVVVLGLVYIGFELFGTEKSSIALGVLDEVEVFVIEEDTPATDTPPPPPIQQKDYLLNIVDENIKIILDDIIFPDEYGEEDIIPEYEPVPIVDIVPDLPPPVKFPEVMPEPIGGLEAMYAFLKSNIKYPEIPLKNGIFGQVIVEFVVEKDGSISNVKVLAGAFPDLDQEAVRVVKMLPKWKPGEQLGKKVRCSYQIPIRFTIN